MNTTTLIAFDSIGFNPNFLNSRDEVGDVTELAKSIVGSGLHTPLWVLVDETNEDRKRYYLIAGFRRHAAISLIRKETPDAFEEVEVREYRCTLAEAHLLNLMENLQRKDLSEGETAVAVERLANLGFKQPQIAEKVGRSTAWVSAILQFRKKAIPRLQSAVDEGTVKPSLARNLASLSEEEQEKQLQSLKGTGQTELTTEEKKQRQAAVKKQIRQKSTRLIRPSTSESRNEVERLKTQAEESKLDDFQTGMLVALEWSLGQRKTLRRPS